MRAYKVKRSSAGTLSVRIMRRPHILARLNELRAAAASNAVLTMSRRRLALARIAEHRAGWKSAPSYSDRIAAIREDAVLAGERRVDGTQLTLNGDVNISVVLNSLRVCLASAPGADATELVAAAAAAEAPSSSATPVAAQATAFGGPLGVVRSLSSAELQTPVAAAETAPVLVLEE